MIKLPARIPLTKVTAYAEKIAQHIEGGEIFALSGELGSGKTTFTKALGKALGIKQNIPSPTFVIMQEFPTNAVNNEGQNITLYHLDLYRTNGFKEITTLGITEWWGHPQTVTVIEWADKITDQLPKQAYKIHLYRDV